MSNEVTKMTATTSNNEIARNDKIGLRILSFSLVFPCPLSWHHRTSRLYWFCSWFTYLRLGFFRAKEVGHGLFRDIGFPNDLVISRRHFQALQNRLRLFVRYCADALLHQRRKQVVDDLCRVGIVGVHSAPNGEIGSR